LNLLVTTTEILNHIKTTVFIHSCRRMNKLASDKFTVDFTSLCRGAAVAVFSNQSSVSLSTLWIDYNPPSYVATVTCQLRSSWSTTVCIHRRLSWQGPICADL